MFRVLICDDEDNICHLIVKLIDWETLDLLLVGTVHTGREALSAIVSDTPDIVITDIRMPDVDGIEMINQTKQLGIPAKFIVISGYQYFEYAHGALKAGVTDYLLKPINGAELNAALRNISQEIVRESEKKAQISTIETSISSIREMERTLFVKNVIMGNSSMYTPYQQKLCGLDFAGDTFCALIFCFDTESDTDPDAREQAMEALMRKTEDFLSKENFSCLRDIVTQRQQNCLICIINYSEKHSGVVHSYIDDIYYSCHRTVCGFTNMHVTLGVGEAVKCMSDLSLSVSSAYGTVHSRVAMGVDRIIRREDIPVMFSHTATLPTAALSTLCASMDLCDNNTLDALIGELFSGTDIIEAPPVLSYGFAHEMLEEFRKKSAESDVGSMDGAAIYDRASQALELAWRRNQIVQILKNAFGEYFDAVKTRRSQQDNQPIAMAKEYIANHYADSCSLDDVANHVHLTSNYLSSLFKKKTGVAMNNYIAFFRINKAKLMLKDTDEPIQDIAEKVGYRDLKHFRRVFKQNVGLSPAKYRSLYK